MEVACKFSVTLHEVETFVADEGLNVSIVAHRSSQDTLMKEAHRTVR